MLRFLRDQFVFLREFGTRFETTGSIVPSSRFLARAITRYLSQRGDQPIRVLECGPGTGAFTDQIVRHLRAGDHFDLVELNEAFVGTLQKRFATEPHWHAVAEQSKIHQLPLQDFAESNHEKQEPYDFIISGLPHVNFPPELVQSIFESYFRLLKPDGTLSYFEYMYIRPLRRTFTIGQARRKMAGVNRIVESFLQQHRLRRDNTFINLPPAWVQHLKQGN